MTPHRRHQRNLERRRREQTARTGYLLLWSMLGLFLLLCALVVLR